MRILLINPNISDSVSALIDAEAKRTALPDTSIRTVTAAFGVAYIETRFEAMIGAYAAAQLAGEYAGQYASTNPAKAYGLHPQKGTIAPGADADLVIWDEKPVTVKNSALHHNVDYTPYEGMELNAWPAMTISRGEVVWDGKNFIPRAGKGQFLHCGKPTIMTKSR